MPLPPTVLPPDAVAPTAGPLGEGAQQSVAEQPSAHSLRWATSMSRITATAQAHRRAGMERSASHTGPLSGMRRRHGAKRGHNTSHASMGGNMSGWQRSAHTLQTVMSKVSVSGLDVSFSQSMWSVSEAPVQHSLGPACGSVADSVGDESVHSVGSAASGGVAHLADTGDLDGDDAVLLGTHGPTCGATHDPTNGHSSALAGPIATYTAVVRGPHDDAGGNTSIQLHHHTPTRSTQAAQGVDSDGEDNQGSVAPTQQPAVTVQLRSTRPLSSSQRSATPAQDTSVAVGDGGAAAGSAEAPEAMRPHGQLPPGGREEATRHPRPRQQQAPMHSNHFLVAPNPMAMRRRGGERRGRRTHSPGRQHVQQYGFFVRR